jgi:outer membrane lipoprotein-sorting protein
MFMKLFQSLIMLTAIICCLGLDASHAMESANSQTTLEVAQGMVMRDQIHDGASFINDMVTASAALNNYVCDYKMVVHNRKPPEIETGKLYFRQPRLMRGEIKTGAKRGSVAILCKDGKVRGHAGGILSWLSGTLSPDSNMLRCINGFPFVETDFASLARYLKCKMLDKGDKSLVSDQPVRTANTEAPAYVLDTFRGPQGQEVLLKRVYVDPKSMLPVYWEDYQEGKLYAQSYWTDLKVDQDFPDSLFTP